MSLLLFAFLTISISFLLTISISVGVYTGLTLFFEKYFGGKK